MTSHKKATYTAEHLQPLFRIYVHEISEALLRSTSRSDLL